MIRLFLGKSDKKHDIFTERSQVRFGANILGEPYFVPD